MFGQPMSISMLYWFSKFFPQSYTVADFYFEFYYICVLFGAYITSHTQ